MECKAGFYDASKDFDEQFNALVRQQIAVADKQQVARDFVFRDNRTTSDGRLVQIHMRMLDIYEYLLSSNTDYPLLRQWLAQGARLLWFNRLLALVLVATALWMLTL